MPSLASNFLAWELSCLENHAIMEGKCDFFNSHLKPNNLLKIDIQMHSPMGLVLALSIETFVHHKGILVSETIGVAALVFQASINKDNTAF